MINYHGYINNNLYDINVLYCKTYMQNMNIEIKSTYLVVRFILIFLVLLLVLVRILVFIFIPAAHF